MRRFYLTNMFRTLLTLIAIFLIDSTLGKAFDSQCNNKDIFWKDSRGKQRAKEMLWKDHANFCTIPLKSETHDTTYHTGIKPLLRSLGLSSFLDTTTGLFQSMDYVPTFPTGIEPLSLSSSSNKTNGLSQNEDSVSNDDSALIILQICIPMTQHLLEWKQTKIATPVWMTSQHLKPFLQRLQQWLRQWLKSLQKQLQLQKQYKTSLSNAFCIPPN